MHKQRNKAVTVFFVEAAVARATHSALDRHSWTIG